MELKGSYGTYPIEIRSALRRYQERTEARPDTFIRYEYRTNLLDKSRRAVADYLQAPLETCVLVPNATTGIDTVLRNLVYRPGDVIICFATVYDAFANTLQHLSETTSVKVRKVEYTLPVSDRIICDAFEAMIGAISAEGNTARVALFDTISSLPGARMPFEKLTRLCHRHNVLSCIDGAHGIGQIPLRLRDLDPDFFVTNCHKWLHVPRGCAVLYVPIRNQHYIRATMPTGFAFLPESQKSGTNNFVANFAAIATTDDTPYLCIPAALEWRKSLAWNDLAGEEAIIRYNMDLARRGGRLVAVVLGTEVLENTEGTLGECAMTNVRLPLTEDILDRPDIGQITGWIGKVMNLEHDIAVNVFFYAGACWVRLSAQVYLELKHFEAAAAKLQVVCEKAVRRGWEEA